MEQESFAYRRPSGRPEQKSNVKNWIAPPSKFPPARVRWRLEINKTCVYCLPTPLPEMAWE